MKAQKKNKIKKEIVWQQRVKMGQQDLGNIF